MAPSNYEALVTKLHSAFRSGVTRSVAWREKQLKALLRMYDEQEEKIVQALANDLQKPRHESIICELDTSRAELQLLLKNLDKWTAPEQPQKTFVNAMDGVQVVNDPLGVVLIMGAWNYPINLTMLPLQGAIAAGNCVVLKPSDLAEHTGRFLAETLPKYLDQECVKVVLGGVPETTELLRQKFDLIFYTGSTRVGQIVYEAATKNLTPVVLELGGKSPVYIDETANLEIAAKRIIWGKFMNFGQTCIAPDYILCTKSIEQKFLTITRQVLADWYGSDPKKSADLGRIISANHFKRLEGLLRSSGKIAIGGRTDENDLYIEPTILTDVKASDPIMQEEIFGPILPIYTISSLDEAIAFIEARDKPLVIYAFTADKEAQRRFKFDTTSGGLVFNDTMMHAAVECLPFGGVGASGTGHYHGKASFDTFVHKKSTLVRNFNAVGERLAAGRYPPYNDKKLASIRFMLQKLNFPLPKATTTCLNYIITFMLGALFVVFLNAVGLK